MDPSRHLCPHSQKQNNTRPKLQIKKTKEIIVRCIYHKDQPMLLCPNEFKDAMKEVCMRP